MKNTLETRLGIFFALALIVAVILLEMVGVADFFKPGYTITSHFKTIQELKEGDPVKMAGVEIGRVEAIRLTNDQVLVQMKIRRKNAEIKTDSKAIIKFAGLLGQNFVAVDFGTIGSPRAIEGATLQSVEQPDLSTLMVKIENVASGIEGLSKSFTPDNLAPLFGPITDFMKQNSSNLTSILGNTREVTEQIRGGQGTVGKLLYDDTLYNTTLSTVAGLQTITPELRSTVTQAKTMLDQVSSGEGTLGKLMKDEALYRETTTAMVNLREILEKINRGQGSVGKLVNDESFYKNVKLTLQKVDKATEGLEDQGPLSVLGIAVNSLF